MASLEFTTNLRLIDGSARTTVPTPEELPLGYMCFGIINGRASVWGNYDGNVHDLVEDDVLEYNNKSSFPVTGETGKIYIDKSTNLIYRWSGSTYIMVGGGDLNVVQTTGDSETDVMSQKAVTEKLAEKADKTYVDELTVVLTQEQVDLLF